MDDIALMQILDGAQQIINDGLYMQNLQVDATFQNLFEITLSELHHHVNSREVFWVLWQTDLNQLNDTRMSQFS